MDSKKTLTDSLIKRQLGLWGNSFSKRMLKQAIKCTENCVLTQTVYTVFYIIIFSLEKADNLCAYIRTEKKLEKQFL